jgi:hypothetical protein
MTSPRFRPQVLAVAAIALMAPQTASAMTTVAPVQRSEVARISDAALASISARQLADGRFADPTGRRVGGGGLPTVAFAALHAGAAGGKSQLQLARRTLMRGDGATVILRWPLAMAVADGLTTMSPQDRAVLQRNVASWGKLHAAGIAQRCYVKPSCFNNYKLVDALLNLELARTGLHSRRGDARLAHPAELRRRSLHWLGAALPSAVPATARVRVPGQGVKQAGLLTDPGALPLAYHSLCTAFAVRAMRLAGNDAPVGLRSAAHRALWALVGIAAPNGEVSWSGRGQDQAWTLAAAMYAASAGSKLFAGSDPALAARLRRLADIELVALRGRLTPRGLQILPAGNEQLTGLDSYYSGVGSTGLALTFLEMARDELAAAGATRAPLPSEVQGGGFSDPSRSGLLTRRVGPTWMAVRMRRDHQSDPRQDAGIARALRLRPGGGWTEDRVARAAPAPTGGSAPGAGPLLVAGGQPLFPRATQWTPATGGLAMSGAFRGRSGRSTAARWRVSATPTGIALRVGCHKGATLQLTEYLPRAGVLRRGARTLERGGAQIRLPGPFQARELSTRFANARQPYLTAYRITVRCQSDWATFAWSSTNAAAA